MKLLDRYLMAQFAKNLVLVICSLIAIYLLVDFFERLDNFLEAKKTIGLAIQFLLLKLPFMYMQLIPVCLLLAGIITLGILNQHLEFMALMASGISVLRIIRPLLVAAALFTLLTLAIGQWLLPPTTAATNRIWYEEVKREIPRGIIRDGRTYFRGTEGIYSFVRPNPNKNEFRNFSFTAFDAEHGLITMLTADSASWESGNWLLKNGQQKQRNDKGGFSVSLFKTLSHGFAEAPEEFFVPPYKIEELSYTKLLRQARDSKASNHEALVEFHRRLSYAFLGIPLLLLGIPVLLSVHKTRGRDLALAIPVSCGLAFAAWGGWSATQSLATTAVLPPGIASWSIHVLTIGLGCFLLKKHNQ
ncbi:LptF/LptG family permease [Thiovibrio frasassiensis]|uniref:LptF/LptG family permease n=1 Tax=Thiovibrio frasassiensis TaxID=2984131 RepID=A0A9X4ME88_9BACT|nr:LptF/LptG family permease [Thiovibrio frasassiensis]MDG4474700.1 LptF/LptG family permease [Thiovibrio frasassiensis]